jgi:alpha-beta hydrolase superfamily lysophospholipase
VVEPEVDGGGATVVLAHGWGSTYGKMVPVARALLQGGHPVFLFDIRHHGHSPPAPYVTARHFRDDIGAAAREMKGLYPDRPLVLVGHSMGGSTGILAATNGAPLQGLVAIGSPADLWEVWARHLQDRGLPGRLIISLLWPFWRRRAGVPLRCLQPEKEAGELQVPLLVIHGDKDESVAVEHAHVLAAAGGSQAFIMEGGDHNRILDHSDLHERLLSFLRSVPA